MKFANKIWWSGTCDRIGICGALFCYKNLMFLVLKFVFDENFKSQDYVTPYSNIKLVDNVQKAVYTLIQKSFI